MDKRWKLSIQKQTTPVSLMNLMDVALRSGDRPIRIDQRFCRYSLSQDCKPGRKHYHQKAACTALKKQRNLQIF